VTLRDEAKAAGRRLDEFSLDDVGAEVTTIRRGRERIEAKPGTVLQAGDVVVLRGSADAVERAEDRLA
jgi:CPA2 family monovalent cation:H+ antiporter-2